MNSEIDHLARFSLATAHSGNPANSVQLIDCREPLLPYANLSITACWQNI